MGEHVRQKRTHQAFTAEAPAPLMKGLLLRCCPEEVLLARRTIRQTLSGYRRDVVELVEQCASETVTNAIVHSDSKSDGETGTIMLVIVELPEKIRIEVIDDGAKDSAPQIDAREDIEKEGGRGLFIVETLADGWGTHVDEHGRNVWFEVHV
ncbi:ATP-binding protein [Actinomadura meridiana]